MNPRTLLLAVLVVVVLVILCFGYLLETAIRRPLFSK